MLFWVIIGLLILLTVSLFALALLRGRDTGVSAAQFDLQLYRDQLNGIERDLERGVVSKEEAARIKVEVSRRLLEADKAVQATGDVTRAPRGVTYGAILLSGVVLAGSVWVYQVIGAPGYPDLPLQLRIDNAEEMRTARPSQAEAEASMPANEAQADPRHLELVAKLRTAVAERPDDLKGHQLLAGNEAALGNYSGAYRAHIKVIEILGDKATARDLADLADLMIMAAGGYVSPEAETALQKALERDPNEGKARYYSGLMFAQSGRPDMAFQLWRDLLEVSASNAPWVGPIRGQIEDAAAWAGVNYTLPALASGAAIAGPDADAVEAASEMTPEERKEMIGNMVVQLSERLATEGGSAQEWAQLIGALGVLGEVDRARAIWGEAQSVFAADADGLAMIRASAKSAGVAE
ncbi:c-type cytochrome biogenesis protein CcmI [Profundibacter sp.]